MRYSLILPHIIVLPSCGDSLAVTVINTLSPSRLSLLYSPMAFSSEGVVSSFSPQIQVVEFIRVMSRAKVIIKVINSITSFLFLYKHRVSIVSKYLTLAKYDGILMPNKMFVGA